MKLEGKHYVLAFAFDKLINKIVCVLKDRPEFQKNKINGPGGKVEPKDMFEASKSIHSSLQHAIAREFEEETGVWLSAKNWDYFAEVTIKEDALGGEAIIHCLRAFDNEIYECRTTESERVMITPVTHVVLGGDTNKVHFEIAGVQFMPNFPLLTMIAKNKNITFVKLTLEK